MDNDQGLASHSFFFLHFASAWGGMLTELLAAWSWLVCNFLEQEPDKMS